MAGDVVLFQPPAHLQKYAGKADNSDLTQGVQASFAVLSFKGKVWRVKYQGEERVIKNRDGDPTQTLICVLVKASPQISKIYYPGSYKEGDDSPPTCFSIDGVRPDPSVQAPQAPTCASCPKNIWGSKITEQGNKTKACSDSRRIALVPYPDVANEAFGGPLLLRIPPASLQEIYRYGKYLDDMGVNYTMLVTKVKFDPEAAYPKLMFSVMEHPESGQPIWLTEEQMQKVAEWRESDVVERMLAEAPITDASETPAEAAHATAPKPAPAAAPPAEEPKDEPPKEEPKAEEPAMDMGMDMGAPPAEEPPKEEPKQEKKANAKEANAAEAEPVSGELDQMLGGLLTS